MDVADAGTGEGSSPPGAMNAGSAAVFETSGADLKLIAAKSGCGLKPGADASDAGEPGRASAGGCAIGIDGPA